MNKNLNYTLQNLLEGNDYTDYQYINNRTTEILNIDNPTEQDIEDANTLITISNILYNNTDRDILPLDDGVYDLLIKWIGRFKTDWQVGAIPTAIIQQNQPDINNEISTELVRPLIKLEPKRGFNPDDMIFYQDIMMERQEDSNMYLKRPIYDLTPQKKQNTTTPHNYPKLVGTLDKCKFVLNQQAIDKGVFNDANVQIFERDYICKLISSGILDPDREFYMVLELKYDGVSIEAEVSDRVHVALSRGDTNNNIATDYTQVLKNYRFPKADGILDPNSTIGMKFEGMLSNLDLSRLSVDREKVYKNPRNAMVGLLGSTDANKWRDYITLVPLATSLDIDRLTEIEFMNKYYDNGEILRYAVIHGDYKEILFQVKRFVDEAEYLRPIMPYIYDGVVASFIDLDIIQALGRVNSINKYQMAIKFNAQKANTIFTGYTFSVAQNGVITPLAHYKPVELFGCIHSKTTVHSYKRFIELGLKIGDIVSIELINDVIPYITRMDIKDNETNPNPLIPFPEICPECGSTLEISSTGKTAICPNRECPGRAMGIVVNMLSKIGFKDFSEESLKTIGIIHNLKDLLNITREDVLCLGEKEADNFMIRLNELKTTPIYDFRIIGSLGFTDVAEGKWKLILNKLPIHHLISNPETLRTDLLAIKGVGPNTADTIVSELEIFIDDLMAIFGMNNIIYTYLMKLGKKIRFTGIRDNSLTELLCSMGHDAKNGGGVIKDTDILIIPDESYTSPKFNTVGPQCIIVTIDRFKSNMEVYL